MTEFDRWKAAVRDGELTRGERTTDGPMTFAMLAQLYEAKHVRAKKLALAESFTYRVKPLLAYFGHRRLRDIRAGDIEDFIAELRQPRVVNGQPGKTLKPASINRNVELLRGIMNFAVDREYLDATPFRRRTRTLIKSLTEDNKRTRRVSEDEEQRLLHIAPAMLRALIIVGLDTGVRKGEMLALRFSDIDRTRRLIALRGTTTKNHRTRYVPIGTERLLAVLEWLRLDTEGRHKPDDTAVFSNELGDPIKSFRKAWVTTVLRASGVPPRWRRKGGYRHLTPECQEVFQQINLHWHDLRHEFASRLVEKGVLLAQVRDLLGHASIATTERYDTQTLDSLRAATKRLEDGKTFVLPATNYQEVIKIDSSHTV